MLRRSRTADSSPPARATGNAGRVRTTTAAPFGASRFERLWRRCVVSPPSPDGAEVYARLTRLLGAPYRRYHTLDHIHDCLRRLDRVAALLKDPDAVELGIWFHDAIYEMDCGTNEQESAKLFEELGRGADPAFRRRVCGLIMATRHTGGERDQDRRYIVDIDLAGFGASWDEFMRNGSLLREESPKKTDAQYHCGQISFLQRLQRRRHFFATEYFRDRYEAKARANVRRLLEDLAKRGYAASTR
jgi:predicted metal-dependent HD superfamily phosphohydrolase